MAGTAKRSHPDLWEEVKVEVTRGDKGGAPGTWSARKAQLAVTKYKKLGGGYIGKKTADNHLVQWTAEQRCTESAEPNGVTRKR